MLKKDIQIEFLHLSPLRPHKKPPVPTPDVIDIARTQGLEILPSIVARQTGKDSYEILTGATTWMVAQQIQSPLVMTIILNDISDEDARKLLLSDDPSKTNVIEIAKQLKRLIETHHITTYEAGRCFSLSRTEVSHRLRLLKLDKQVRSMLVEGKLKMGHARALVGLPPRQQLAIARSVVTKRLSVRETENRAKAAKAGTFPARSETKISSSTAKDANHLRLEEVLTQTIGSPVEINYSHENNGQGRVIIQFANLDVLDGILEKIGLTKEF